MLLESEGHGFNFTVNWKTMKVATAGNTQGIYIDNKITFLRMLPTFVLAPIVKPQFNFW